MLQTVAAPSHTHVQLRSVLSSSYIYTCEVQHYVEEFQRQFKFCCLLVFSLVSFQAPRYDHLQYPTPLHFQIP